MSTTSDCSRRPARRIRRPAASPGSTTLRRLGAYTGESDHGATLSIYGADPDGNEFEVMWQLPREQWVEHENDAPVRRLDMTAALARHGSG